MPDERHDQLLLQAENLTTMIRQHQDAVAKIGARRREVIRALRADKIPYRVIAAACGVTDQALFADLRKHPQD